MSQNAPSMHRDLRGSHHDHGFFETLQSLIVAFVLAMTFRGFVAEGFVIPTGSMAPTLMGQHALVQSELTGWEFAVGLDQRGTGQNRIEVDPMLGPDYTGHGLRPIQARPRMGDRILVLKGLYAFTEPQRFDVVVFKNPTDPVGESANYIKRLIGLPGEQVWIADGDVFARDGSEEPFQIQRKPKHIQRAIWQPIYNSDYPLVNPGRLNEHYDGPPWRGAGWDTTGRRFRTETAEPTALQWDNHVREINDWTAYNMLADGRIPRPVPVSDVRVAAGIVPDEDGLETTLQLAARSHVYEFTIRDNEAHVRYRAAHEPGNWLDQKSATFRQPRPGRVMNVEFWHVDQAMSVFINGRRVVELEYDWQPWDRLENITGLEGRRSVAAVQDGRIEPLEMTWSFQGSPVTLHRVRVDRDLYYRGAMLDEGQQRNEPSVRGPAYGTDPDAIAELGPDHYYMLGDNSQASLDSRLWGSPHPLVAAQIDEGPFVVHRKLLLGKAWVVYFPAPLPLSDTGINVVPDFGRLRYIR